jgi:hypothetical protein
MERRSSVGHDKHLNGRDFRSPPGPTINVLSAHHTSELLMANCPADQKFYGSSDSEGAVPWFSSGCSGAGLGSRTSVASNSVTGSTAGMLGGFIGLTFFRAILVVRALFGVALAKRFLGITLAAVRFAALPRTDLPGLRALPRTVDFRTVGRLFR